MIALLVGIFILGYLILRLLVLALDLRAQERGPHRSREQDRILKEVGTLKVALISMGNPGQASAAAMQCLAEFGIYHDLQMTAQEAHHVTLCPQWKIVLNAMIESRRNELQFNLKAIKQDRWNNRDADRQAERPFWKSTRDLANSPASMGRSQRRRNWSGECPGAAGSNTMRTGCSRRHGMLQPRSSLKIGQAPQSIRYKAHESLSA